MSSDFCIKCDNELSVYCGPCVDTVRGEADKARADFLAVAEALGCVSTDDTGRIGAVASLKEVLDCAVEAVRKANKWDDVQDSLNMACENPPPRCECPGCSYAREKGGAHT